MEYSEINKLLGTLELDSVQEKKQHEKVNESSLSRDLLLDINTSHINPHLINPQRDFIQNNKKTEDYSKKIQDYNFTQKKTYIPSNEKTLDINKLN